jgi:hypothetical protein
VCLETEYRFEVGKSYVNATFVTMASVMGTWQAASGMMWSGQQSPFANS